MILWYKLYLGFLFFLFLIVVAAGAFLLFSGKISEADLDGMPPQLMGGIYLGMGLALAIPCLIAFFLPRNKFAWIFHFVLICIGMTGCTVGFSIPLIIFWIKPEVKRWFHMN